MINLMPKVYVIPSLTHKVSNAKKHGLDFVELWGNGQTVREFIYR